jgi:hypothetical protein
VSKSICAACGESAPDGGIFTCHAPHVPAPICFACVIIGGLRSAECRCGGPVVGFVAIETVAGRVAPVAVCPRCIVTQLDGSEVEVLTDSDRSLIRDAGQAG